MLTAKLIVERLDKEGRLLERREQQSNSFLIQFMQFLQQRHDAIVVNILDITNVARAAAASTDPNLSIAAPGGYGAVAGPGTAATIRMEGQRIGIVEGTGVAAVTPTNYQLATQILHGNGAGQFEYGGNEILPIIIAAPSASFIIRRYFTNNSGGAITVNEAGIYAVVVTVSTAYAACIARDLTGAVAVANTEILRVTYVPQITV